MNKLFQIRKAFVGSRTASFVEGRTRSLTALFLGVFLICSWSASGWALTFPLRAGSDIVGQVLKIRPQPGDTLGTIAERYDIGYVEMMESNPGLSTEQRVPLSREVLVPAGYVLPSAPRRGVVINLAELRVYFFPSGSGKVVTFPVGIGREGWGTPVGASYISAKVKNPTWYPTKAVRADAAAQGYYLPPSVPPGPDNPLGKYSLRLGATTYLMHSTNKTEGVGRRSSAGCMRMYPHDAEYLFHNVAIGTPVYVVNQPVKAGWSGNKLYLEAHIPLQEHLRNDGSDTAPIVKEVLRVAKQRTYRIDWEMVKKVATEQSGLPTVVGYSVGGNTRAAADGASSQEDRGAVAMGKFQEPDNT